jgi:hypothetical protein
MNDIRQQLIEAIEKAEHGIYQESDSIFKVEAIDLITTLIPEGMVMVPVTIEKGAEMPRTVEHYQANAIRDQELIIEQKDEISLLQKQVNQLRQRIAQYKENAQCKP